MFNEDKPLVMNITLAWDLRIRGRKVEVIM
jgi:hypothetical protein